ARAALADAGRAAQAARRAGGLECGELDVATIYSISLGVLPPVLRAWRRAYPDVHVRLLEFRHADELRAAMEAGRADVAVGPLPPDWDGTVREIGSEKFVLVLPPDDPAAADGPCLDLRTLADRGWVHYAPGHGLAELLDRACAAAGFTPRAAVRTEQTATAPILAAAGLGPTLTPANVIPARFDGALRWPDPPITRALAGYARTGPDALTHAFLDDLATHARPARTPLRESG
ncbi:MAG: LysR family transcriptional regulator substrate-binding protein, partial [Pseudonocardia sp.]|nr:LysR family transcriptional regulator substrate-binding protein [Pseudonocardia sp.]